jgi:hypothetical protein
MSIRQSKVFEMPCDFGDGRLDTLLSLFSSLKQGGADIPPTVSWKKTKSISPAGSAILAALADTTIEQKQRIKLINLTQTIKAQSTILHLLKTQQNKLPPADSYSTFNEQICLLCSPPVIQPIFMQRLEEQHSKHLSDELAFSCRLVINELMQNTISHSSGDRYYMYAGPWQSEYHVGVLDMGVTIPAKLEQKYQADSDVGFLELALQKGITTRRERSGGLGLNHTFELLKNSKGRLTIISRKGQLRRYFASKTVHRRSLPSPLYGTWCMVRFPKNRRRT